MEEKPKDRKPKAMRRKPLIYLFNGTKTDLAEIQEAAKSELICSNQVLIRLIKVISMPAGGGSDTKTGINSSKH